MTGLAHWEFWVREVDVPRQRAIDAARQRAEAAEAGRDCTAEELERLWRVYRAMRAGVRLPFMAEYPLAMASAPKMEAVT